MILNNCRARTLLLKNEREVASSNKDREANFSFNEREKDSATKPNIAANVSEIMRNVTRLFRILDIL